LALYFKLRLVLKDTTGLPILRITHRSGRTLANASITTVVSPNDDTLYGSAWLDLTSEPVVLKVPPISDRYYTFQLLDAYTNDYAYVGTRATGANGGTYLITGPYWNGTVPNRMTQIWSQTELVWVLNRILVKGSADLPNVHAIQDKITVQPLSVFEEKTASPQSQPATKQMPVPLQPTLIPTTGIKIYDQIGQAMVGNPPNPSDPVTLAKFASIGIGPDKTPSKEAATNSTLNTALQDGITEGEKSIDLQIQNLGIVANGWHIAPIAQNFGNNYLLRAAVAKQELGANYPNEAVYAIAFTDVAGANLTGINNYTVHFTQVPPVKAGRLHYTTTSHCSIIIP